MTKEKRKFFNTIPSHHPRILQEDAFGYKDIAQTTIQMIELLDSRNQGVTFGIYGDWGMGKSSVVKMIANILGEKRILEIPLLGKFGSYFHKIIDNNKLFTKIFKHPNYLVVEFDAWHYQNQEDLWLALIRRIMNEVQAKVGSMKIFQMNTALYISRFLNNPQRTLNVIAWIVRIFMVMFLVGLIISEILASNLPVIQTKLLPELLKISFLAHYVKLLNQPIKFAVQFGYLLSVIGVLLRAGISLTKNLIKGEVNINLPPLADPGFDHHKPISIDSFKIDFSTIIRTIGRKRTVVVLIDDLDRCDPQQIVPVLEAIKHLGDVDWKKDAIKGNRPLIVFILAVDRRELDRAIFGYFKEYMKDDLDHEIFTQSYLEKIVHIPIPLPPLTEHQISIMLKNDLINQTQNI